MAPLRIALVLGALCLVVAASDARADRQVFLNGIDLHGVDVSDQKFAGCTVRFDGDGNVHISAPGIEIKKRKATGASGAGDADEPAKLTKRYYLANKGDRAGKAQFDVTVYINGERVKTVRAGAEDGVTEVTKYLRAGTNAVRVVAVKRLGKSGKRRSFSPEDQVEILLGEGEVDKGVVTIRRTVVQYERNASETGKFTEELSFRTR